MRIFYEDKNVIAVEKPAGVPSESAGDEETVVDLVNKECKSTLYLIHRLDRNVGGIMIFAKNKKTAAFLNNEIQNGVFKKEYLLVTDGIPQEKSGIYEDLLFKDSRSNRSFVVKRERKGVKKASLEYRVLSEKNEKALVKVLLNTGRSHQIRVQFSSRKLPLCGDGKYGSRDNSAENIALFSARLTVKIPGGEEITFTALPNTEKYPWNIFKGELNESIFS